MRITTLDGLRGYFILMMMMVHLDTIDPFLRNFSHHRLGFVEDAQGFVFLSGIVVALAYVRIFERTSFEEMRRKLFSRVGKLAVYNAASLAVVFGLAFAGFTFSDQIREFARIGDAGWQDVVLALLLIDGPTNVDILPMYICFMLIAPFAIRSVYANGALPVMAISIGVWVLAQSGVFLALSAWGTALLGLEDDGGLNLNLYFVRWAWQILFFAGLCFGVLAAQGRIELSRLREPGFEKLFFLALAGIAVFFLLRVNGKIELMQSPFLDVGLDRSNMGLLRLANFSVCAYAFTYLIVAGPMSARRWIAALASVLHLIVGWRPLVFLGRYSLQAYALQVVLVYVVASLVFRFDLSLGAGTADAVLIACWGALFVPGLWAALTRRKRQSAAIPA